MSTTALATLGVLLVLLAIPLGLMLAPLIVGAVIVAVSLGRVGAAVAPVEGVPA